MIGPTRLLVEVVADPGAMREQVLDRHGVADERQVVAEERPRRRRELQRRVLDEAHHRERRQALRGARGPEPGVDRVLDPGGAIREPVRLSELRLAAAIDADDAREVLLRGDSFDEIRHALHGGQSTRCPRAERCYTLARAAA